jgi:hypothetical protein
MRKKKSTYQDIPLFAAGSIVEQLPKKKHYWSLSGTSSGSSSAYALGKDWPDSLRTLQFFPYFHRNADFFGHTVRFVLRSAP